MANNRVIPENVKGAAVTFTVKIGGKAIPKTFEVYSICVIKEVNRVPSAKLTLIDGDPAKETFTASNDSLFVPGQEIELLAGHQSKEDLIFKGIIVKHAIAVRKTGSSELKLECRDAAFQMTQGLTSTHFKNVKDSDIANQLFSKYKISVSKLEQTSRKHSEIIQFNSSDWDFIITRMDVNGKLVFVNDGKVEVRGPDFSLATALFLQYGATIHELDAEMDVRNQYAGVKAVSWDPASQKRVEVNGKTPSSVKENGNIQSSKLANATGLKELLLRHGGNIARDELQSWADSCMQKSLLAKIRGRVTCDGFAKIKPGDLIELSGLGDRFNGKVFISAVRQDVSNGGWTTSLQFGMEPDWFSEKIYKSSTNQQLVPTVQGLHVGVVAQLEDDPNGEDRILINLPMVNMDAGVWARIATLDAGEKRGSFFRPYVGDEVIVGFIKNDPREAIVLGTLNSSKKPAPLMATKDNHEKGFFFKNKMKIIIHEDDKSISLETPKGNKIVLSEKDKGITMQDQNGNKLILNNEGITLESSKKLTIKASSGDIESEGLNIKQKASSQFKAEGSAGIELTSSAIAKLKGSLVQIN